MKYSNNNVNQSMLMDGECVLYTHKAQCSSGGAHRQFTPNSVLVIVPNVL